MFPQAELQRLEQAEREEAHRAAETPEQFQARQTREGVFDKAAFEYDETLDYESHKLIKIEAMNEECRLCGALKWKEESAGMCCSRGVALPSIDEPVEPLKELFSYETDQSLRFL
ncbi:uncharacterized protein TNCV_4930691 [Trichonephila clavipes]|nr:uncharacterized protein TNCV_4930691 [Trichonephila clavipes]